jgi:hypothetical protein
MWRRRLRHSEVLEQRSAKAEQERQDLRDTLTAFEAIARAAGVHLGSAEPDVVSEVPPSVIAAASPPGPGGLPVVVDVGARRVVAVTGPAGDPREWMPSIAAAASLPAPAGQVTRIERAPMPAGLLAAAAIPRARRPAVRLAGQITPAEPARHRPAHRRQRGRRPLPGGLYRDTLTAAGGLAVRVADTLTAAQARQATIAAVRAARRNGWEASRTAAITPVLAAAAGWYVAAIPVRAAIFTGVATATATAAGVAISVLPGHPVMPPDRVRSLPASALHAQEHVHHRDKDRKRASHLTADTAPVTPSPSVSPSGIPALRPKASATPDRTKSARPRRTDSPEPQPTTSSPSPSPTPSPSPSSSGLAGECIGVVVLKVCVTL